MKPADTTLNQLGGTSRLSAMTGYCVIDAHGKRWPNLVGVFRSVFPIAVGNATAIGEPQSVTYYGETFEIRPLPKPRKAEQCEHIDGDQWREIVVGEYKGTLTSPLSLRYDLGGGNVGMRRGETADDGQACTLYTFADSRRRPRYELDE